MVEIKIDFLPAFIALFFITIMVHFTSSTYNICDSPKEAPAEEIAPASSPSAVVPAPSPDFPGSDLAPDANQPSVFDVTGYGAVADGETESSSAFLSAWRDACAYDGNPTVLIPKGTFFVGPVTFNGPCYNNQSPKIEIRGILQAPSSLDAFPSSTWIVFQRLHGLKLIGELELTVFDAQGAEAWTNADCLKYDKCHNFPATLKFVDVSSGTVSNVSLLNSKGFHINILRSDNIVVDGVNITAPSDSPNTDGIHISYSTNINITSSTIGVGDDCVSIGPGCTNISVFNVKCGPGHGISVGSLGKYPKEENVVGVSVKNCTIKGTQNGVRIKTWPGAPSSMASNLTFEDIIMIDVSNPIIIDQEYCPGHFCLKSKPSLVKLSNVQFKNIRGTSNTKYAVTLLCSSGVPCENIQLVNVSLNYSTTESDKTASLRVKGAIHGVEILV